MFTGLVEALGVVARIVPDGPSQRLEIDAGASAEETAVGDSVAINGCCLTVVRRQGGRLSFQAGPETLAKTNLGRLAAGDKVNLERAMRPSARLGGHIVQGHVDGVGTVLERRREGEWETVWFAAGSLARQMVPKGSVAVDGVSLTVVDVSDERFSVALIPHTLAATTLGFKRAGATVNLETDILGKYVLAYLERIGGGLNLQRLRDAGFVP